MVYADMMQLASTVTGFRLKILLSPSAPSKPMSCVTLSNEKVVCFKKLGIRELSADR